MSIRAVIWDIGGVLVRTIDREPRNRLALELGLTYEQLENAVFNAESGQKAQLGLVTTDEVWRRFARAVRQPDSRIPEMQAAFLGGDVLDRGLVNQIRDLHRDYATGIISNYFDNARYMLTEVWHIADVFDHIVISSEVGVVKPDARIYQLALDGLGVAPGEAVFLDDFSINVTGAQQAGLHAIHFRSPEQALLDLHTLLAQNNLPK